MFSQLYYYFIYFIFSFFFLQFILDITQLLMSLNTHQWMNEQLKINDRHLFSINIKHPYFDFISFLRSFSLCQISFYSRIRFNLLSNVTLIRLVAAMYRDLYQLVSTRNAVMIYGCWIFIDTKRSRLPFIVRIILEELK